MVCKLILLPPSRVRVFCIEINQDLTHEVTLKVWRHYMRNLVANSAFALVLAALESFVPAQSVSASGFALIEQSVTGLGNAFAGSAAVADDASTIFFNPAGLTRLPGNSAVGAVYYIAPNLRFENVGSTIATGAPLLGGEGGEAGTNALLPNLYAAWSLSDSVKLGLGIGAPFALATEYERDWVGRYQAVKSKLTTINVNPTIAAKLSDTFSVGAGINIQYAKAELSNAIDFGLIGRSVGLPIQPQSADGFVEIVGDDVSVGFNLGVMYEPTARTRIGLAYRSPVTHKLQGDADFTVPGVVAPLTQTGRFTDTGASAALKIPDSLSLAVRQQVGQRVALLADVTWTNWSRFDELRIDFKNPAQPAAIQPENWKDTFRVGLGLTYAANKALTLRAGVAYDESPVKDEFRTARIPDNDRVWLAIGASYRPSPSLSLDIGYAHLFVKDAPINQSGLTEGTLKGEFSGGVDIVGIQVNWRF